MENQEHSQRLRGTWYAVAAFTTWGILPLYWKALIQVPSEQILAHRIFWSFIFVVLITVVYKKLNSIKEVLSNKKQLLIVMLNSLLISGNWFLYIWAVNAGHIVEASLGYYINPLLTVALGMVFLKERLNFWQLIALGLALTGVLVLAIDHGKVPWIALYLATTFAVYGLTKKKVQIDSLTALLLETAFAAPFALAFLFSQQIGGTGAIGTVSGIATLMLILSGIVTALPLLWFAEAAKYVSLSTIGFFQYLAPSLSLLIGVLIYREPFTHTHLISFTFIWSAVSLFSMANLGFFVRRQPKFFCGGGINE